MHRSLWAFLVVLTLPAAAPAADLTADAQAMVLLFHAWKVARVENLSGGVGHVLLQNGEYEYKEGFGQQGGSGIKPGQKVEPPKHDYFASTEFFAVPEGESRAIGAFPWGRDRRPPYHTERVDLGTWNGRHWYADIGLYHQSYLRTKLGFEGGDDRLALLIKGLGIEDRGSNTRNSCESLLGQEGAPAIPYLERAIAERPGQIAERSLVSLGGIQDPDATRILLNYFENPNPKLSGAATYGLVRQPYRKEAKSAYLSMIEQGKSEISGAKAAVQFGWREALPLLSSALDSTRYLFVYRDLYESYRTLDGHSIAKELLEAEQTLRQTAFREGVPAKALFEAKATLLKSADQEAAALIGIGLADYRTKGDTLAANAFGRELLSALPRPTATAILKKLEKALEDNETRKLIRTILAEWRA